MDDLPLPPDLAQLTLPPAQLFSDAELDVYTQVQSLSS